MKIHCQKHRKFLILYRYSKNVLIKEINNITDAEEFMRQLVLEGTNAHPGEDFLNYVNMTTGLPAYSVSKAEQRNFLMSRSFFVCDAAGQDVYDLMQEIFLKETGLNKYMPLPSQIE